MPHARHPAPSAPGPAIPPSAPHGPRTGGRGAPARAAAGLAMALALAVGAAGLAGCAGRGTTASPFATRLAADDHVLAMQAAGGGLYELEAARLALARAAHPEVRQYAQMLVDHHAGANAELAGLLRGHGLAPPNVLPTRHAARLARLQATPAPSFDQAFVQAAGVADHTVQVGLFEQATRDVQDAALRAWFVRTLPMLRSHLQAAQGLAGTLAARGG